MVAALREVEPSQVSLSVSEALEKSVFPFRHFHYYFIICFTLLLFTL